MPRQTVNVEEVTSLIAYREEAKISRPELAVQLGISRQALWILEHRASERVRPETRRRYLAAVEGCVATREARRVALGKVLVEAGAEILAGSGA